MPRGAGSQLVALEQDGVGDAEFGEMVQGGAPHDPAADNDNGGMGRQGILSHWQRRGARVRLGRNRSWICRAAACKDYGQFL